MIEHTFVIPAYQESAYLEECIQSLLAQTAKSQIVITTSTPADHSRRLALKYGLEYHINPNQNAGIASDWNFALSKADTPLVTIAHQDDTYEPDYTQAVMEQFTAHPEDNVLIAFTNYTDVVDNRVRPSGLNAFVKNALLLPFKFSRSVNSKALKRLILLFGDPICCPSVTFNKAALGNFSFSADYLVALDWLAWYELSQREGAFVYINKKLVRHRLHPASETTRQINNGIRKQEETRLLELMWGNPLARLIAPLYALGHKENITK
jgi:glycosyltransferase involved in cell wall biosynthesis